LSLVSAVWIAAFETLGGWPLEKPLPEKPDAWLRGIARNLSRDNLRNWYRRHSRTRSETTCDTEHASSYDIDSVVEAASESAFDIWDPDSDYADHLVETQFNREVVKEIWSWLNVRHQVAVYLSMPDDIHSIFPLEVGRLRKLSEEYAWSENARYKAFSDAKARVAKARALRRIER